MRVLFITRKFPPSVGGMEIYSKQLYEALRNGGTYVDLHRATHLGRPSLAQMATFFLRSCWILARTARRYDAILLGDFAIASLAIVAKLASFGRARVVVSLHGNDLYFMRKTGLVACVYRMLGRCVVASGTLDAAIANSRAIREEAQRRGIGSVHVVPLATVVPGDNGLARLPRRRMILFAGRLIRYKGLSWFVREVLPHLDPGIELVVAGQVWDPGEEPCLAAERLTYLGALPYAELPAIRVEAMACIMPNLPPAATEQDEGFGLAALEAPAVGTPIVAARCGGLPDAVAEGITGFLLPPLDVDAWVRRINDIAHWSDAERAAFGERARQHVVEHFHWELVARRTLSVLCPDASVETTGRPANAGDGS